MPNGKSVRVQCLRCGHFSVLTPDMLSHLAIAPNTPIAAFVKRLRCRKCGSQMCALIGPCRFGRPTGGGGKHIASRLALEFVSAVRRRLHDGRSTLPPVGCRYDRSSGRTRRRAQVLAEI